MLNRYMKFYFKILILFLFIIIGQEAFSNITKINHIRLSIGHNKTRVVLDATEKPRYVAAVFSDKITINIKRAVLNTSLKIQGIAQTPISSITSEKKGTDLYLALNLKDPVKLHHFTMSKPERLVFDLYPDEKIKEPQVILKPPPSQTVADLDQSLVDKMYKDYAKDSDKNYGSVSIDNSKVKKEAVVAEDESSEDPNGTAPISSGGYKNKDQRNNSVRPIIIVIDPGHGGHDSGAIGYNGTQEKRITLAVAKALQKIINKTRGFRAILTRNDDYFIPLRRRLGIAHEKKADMFISIHADAYVNSSAHGVSVFALSQRGATSEAARWLAQKENESELGQAISDKSNLLRSVLLDLAQTATISASLEIGSKMLQALSGITSLHFHEVEQAAFVVLKSPDIPSLLVEVGFITHGPEERRLHNTRYQEEIASSLALGIQSYFIRRPPPGTYLAKIKPHGVMTLQDSLPTGGAG